MALESQIRTSVVTQHCRENRRGLRQLVRQFGRHRELEETGCLEQSGLAAGEGVRCCDVTFVDALRRVADREAERLMEDAECRTQPAHTLAHMDSGEPLQPRLSKQLSTRDGWVCELPASVDDLCELTGLGESRDLLDRDPTRRKTHVVLAVPVAVVNSDDQAALELLCNLTQDLTEKPAKEGVALRRITRNGKKAVGVIREKDGYDIARADGLECLTRRLPKVLR